MDIHLGHVVTPQDATSTNTSPSTPELLDIPNGAVVVDGSTIVAVGEASDILDAYPDTAFLDHGDALIIPGLVDCHVHYPQIGMIASPGEQLLDWLDRYTFPAEARFAEKAHAEATAEFFTDQLLRNGVTTALVFSTVHAHSVDALFTAAQRKDLRIITGKICMDRNAPADLLDTPESAVADSKALIDRWHGTGRLEYAITPRFAPTSSDAQLRALGELAADYPDVVIQTHLAENT
ncbi:MAG: amidohydrolase family protein, partial [Corynebacterium variabile]